MPNLKSSQRQIVAELLQPTEAELPTNAQKGPAITGYWAQMSGGEVTAAVEKVYDGGDRFPDTVTTVAEVGDITLTRFYVPAEHASVLQNARELVGMAFYDIQVTELNQDLVVPESPHGRLYPKALLVGLTEPEGDSGSSAPVTFSMTFSVGKVGAIATQTDS